MIPLHKVLIAPDAHEAVARTLYSGVITEGDRVKEFEARLKLALGVPVLAVNSCTSALDLALHLCGVGPGDEVIAPPMTCAATTTHVVLRGAKIVWADVDEHTGNIEASSVASVATERTKAVLVVDWGGRAVDCSLIKKAAGGIPVIQDAAHSFGHGDHATNGGDYICWSFQAIKHLTTGDGGALKVPSHQIERARRLRWFGIDRDAKVKWRFLQDIPEAGHKYHMNDLTASLGLANLESACNAVLKHRQNAARLHYAFQGLDDIDVPVWSVESAESSWWFFSLLTPRRDDCFAFLESHGVGCGPVHGRCDSYTAHGVSLSPLPGVDYYYSRHVAIPCGWWLSQADLQQIIEAVTAWDKQL